MNFLVIAAHHDDIELGCGATVAKLVEAGHEVTGLIMTHSGFVGPDGQILRNRETVRREAEAASSKLGYQLVCCDEDTTDVPVNDANICRILSLIRARGIQTILTHWHGDTHPPHQNVHRLAVHASRTVPRLLGFAVNWHIGSEVFAPNYFVPIEEHHFRHKMEAFCCFESEHKRSGVAYAKYHESQTLIYGLQAGVGRAEGFIAYKYLCGGWE